jgi:predicted nucleic acid-binding protein
MGTAAGACQRNHGRTIVWRQHGFRGNGSVEVVTYADTSILVCVYAFEDMAEEAGKLLNTLSHPVPLNPFLWLEMRNAIRRKVPTGKATKAQTNGMLNELERSIAEGALEFRDIDFRSVFDRAEDLSTRLTERLNTRAFDVLHVAISIETGCRAFLTFDKDQAKVAKAAGLEIKTEWA